MPLALGGSLEIEDEAGGKKTIGITRIHLEEDTGKSIHAGEAKSITAADYTLLDYNRAGVPLMEIVSEPDMRSPEEAYRYLSQMKKILTWLGVSDCRMEEGSLRCDANVSLRPAGQKALGTKTEIKNMNSFKAVRSALAFEEARLREILERGGTVTQETRGWEEGRGVTVSMRSKEEAHDYRYFPEPDLLPLQIDAGWVQRARESLPELPQAMAARFVEQYGIPPYDAGVLTATRAFAGFFEQTVKHCNDPKQASNWLMGDVSRYLKEKEVEITGTRLTPSSLGRMITLISTGVISGKMGKEMVEELLSAGGDPDGIVEKKGWKLMESEGELLPLILQAIDGNPQVLEQLLGGKESVRGFFVGHVMKVSRGKASPAALNRLLDAELEKRRGTGGLK
jgi:aspartyl-tRNA(Asn)/glutamyl-tRNA(Gln) amidotransferase subunit B